MMHVGRLTWFQHRKGSNFLTFEYENEGVVSSETTKQSDAISLQGGEPVRFEMFQGPGGPRGKFFLRFDR